MEVTQVQRNVTSLGGFINSNGIPKVPGNSFKESIDFISKNLGKFATGSVEVGKKALQMTLNAIVSKYGVMAEGDIRLSAIKEVWLDYIERIKDRDHGDLTLHVGQGITYIPNTKSRPGHYRTIDALV